MSGRHPWTVPLRRDEGGGASLCDWSSRGQGEGCAATVPEGRGGGGTCAAGGALGSRAVGRRSACPCPWGRPSGACGRPFQGPACPGGAEGRGTKMGLRGASVDGGTGGSVMTVDPMSHGHTRGLGKGHGPGRPGWPGGPKHLEKEGFGFDLEHVCRVMAHSDGKGPCLAHRRQHRRSSAPAMPPPLCTPQGTGSSIGRASGDQRRRRCLFPRHRC